MPWDIFCNRTYKRLKRIYTYAKTFEPMVQTCYDGKFVINFHSELGPVMVEIEWDMMVNWWNYRLNYANYAGSTVFTVMASPENFDVIPTLGENLGGHDIDLALLELENYLYNTYGDVYKEIERRNKEYKAKMDEHKKQLRRLENGK